jgi:hypothetical protein
MNGHFNDVQKSVILGIHSDTFAEHFSRHFVRKPTTSNLREMIKFSIVWQGGALSLSNSF